MVFIIHFSMMAFVLLLFSWIMLAMAVTQSPLTDENFQVQQKNAVGSNGFSAQEINALKLQLNQETSIRLSLITQVYSLVNDVVTMKKEMAAMEAKVQDLGKNVGHLQFENQRLRSEMEDHIMKSNFTDDIQRDLLDLTVAVDDLRNSTKSQDRGAVAFNAYVSKTLSFERNTPVNIVYDTVLYNTDDVYSSLTGFFTAPSDGLYVFAWTSLVARSKIFDAELNVNGQRKGLGNCNNEGNPGYENCANTVPVILKTGDKVNIQTTTGNYIHGHQWSSFKGWRVG